MKLENNIGWCDVTTNPGIGCRGCELGDDCYAKFDTPARVLRAGKWPGRVGQPTETFGPGRTFVPTKSGLEKLRAWHKLCICDNCHETAPAAALGVEHGRRADGECGGEFRRIRAFCDSNSDWMDWPIEVLAAALEEIRTAPNVDVILLTKWPGLFRDRMEMAFGGISKGHPLLSFVQQWIDGGPPENVITLTSVLGNANDEKRIEGILAMPAARRGLSCEPLWALPAVETFLQPGKIDWVILGCDSSKKHKGWETYESNIRSMLPVLRNLGIQIYHKQMPINGRVSLNPNEWPEWALVREHYKQMGDGR